MQPEGEIVSITHLSWEPRLSESARRTRSGATQHTQPSYWEPATLVVQDPFLPTHVRTASSSVSALLKPAIFQRIMRTLCQDPSGTSSALRVRLPPSLSCKLLRYTQFLVHIYGHCPTRLNPCYHLPFAPKWKAFSRWVLPFRIFASALLMRDPSCKHLLPMSLMPANKQLEPYPSYSGSILAISIMRNVSGARGMELIQPRAT